MKQTIETPYGRRLLQERGVLLAIPLAIFVLAVLAADAEGPYYGALNSDPDYIYLFNALNILLFHAPGHTDHPGTTVQLFGAGIVFCKWVLGSLSGTWRPLQESVLTRPEDYLNAIHVGLSCLVSAAVYGAGSRMSRASGSLVAALVLQSTVFMFPETLICLSRVSPEPLLLATGFALLVPLIPILLGEESVRRAFKTGVIVGFGLVTKVTFLPLSLIAALLDGWKQKLRFAAGVLVALLVLLLPIYTKLAVTAQWFFGLLSHSGRYGQGPSGLPTSTMLFTNLKLQYAHDPLLFYWLAYYISVFVALRFVVVTPNAPLAVAARRLLLTGCIIILVQLAMSIKHFAPHYILPCLTITALLNAMLALLVMSSAIRRGARNALVACGAGLLGASVSHNITALNQSMNAGRDAARGIRQLDKKRAELSNCITIGYYRSSLPSFALEFANGYANGSTNEMLEELYPGTITYNIFSNQFLSFAHEPQEALVRRKLSEGRCVLLQGVGRDNLPADFSLQQVAITGNDVTNNRESLFRLTSLSSGEPPTNDFRVPANAITVEAEAFSEGNAVVDTTGYGAGIGVILTPKYPAYVVYEFSAPARGPYTLWSRYASAERRALKLSLNGNLISSTACGEPTDGFSPKAQLWVKVGSLELSEGKNTMRLESNGPFPHLDKFAFVPGEK